MEVSSHALALHRADAIHFDVALFTNLTQDHLDFHADMEDYFALEAAAVRDGAAGGDRQRRRPLRPAAGGGIRVRDLLRRGRPRPISSPTTSPSMPRLRVHRDAAGDGQALRRRVGRRRCGRRLPGGFNVANALAALRGRDRRSGSSPRSRPRRSAEAAPPPGRFEPVDEGQPFAVLVDYAHTPDSLENVLRAARRLTAGRLIVGLRRRRRPRPRQAAEDGAGRGELSDLGDRSPPTIRAPSIPMRSSPKLPRAPRTAAKSSSRSTVARRSRWRWRRRGRATPS